MLKQPNFDFFVSFCVSCDFHRFWFFCIFKGNRPTLFTSWPWLVTKIHTISRRIRKKMEIHWENRATSIRKRPYCNLCTIRLCLTRNDQKVGNIIKGERYWWVIKTRNSNYVMLQVFVSSLPSWKLPKRHSTRSMIFLAVTTKNEHLIFLQKNFNKYEI